MNGSSTNNNNTNNDTKDKQEIPWSASNASSSNGEKISPLELESLTQLDENSHPKIPRTHRMPDHPCDRLLLLLKLYFELYPKLVIAGIAIVVIALIMLWSPWKSWGYSKMHRNYMTEDYTSLQNDFNFRSANIDHWCLFGGDDRCYCEDPLEGSSRLDKQGWAAAHKRNLQLVTNAVGGRPNLDVVFIGDQNVQSWDGRWLDRPAPDGSKIARKFNETFQSKDSTFQGLALGIAGDRLNNILWRIQKGEMPPSLKPKVFWLIAGTNDLALGMCSEEVVTLGIMRLAEEIHHHYPDSVVVIQGILPRSNHKDGSLEGNINKFAARTPGQQHAGSGSRAKDRGGLFHHNNNKNNNNKNRGGPGIGIGGGAGGATGGGGGGGGGGMMNQGNKKAGLGYGGDGLNPFGGPNGRRNAHETTNDPLSRHLLTKKKSNDAEAAKYQAFDPKNPNPNRGSGISAGAGSNHQVVNPKAELAKLAEDLDRKSPQPRFNYYLWPSIQAINKELEGFCSKHDHFVYFDVDDLVLGSVGNKHYKAPTRTIITELMPDYVHLSALGHQVLLDVINDELQRIILDDDESNDIERKSPVRQSVSSSSGGRGGKK